MIFELLIAIALLQAVPSNPRAVVFQCPDHAQDTAHELDIVDSAGVVIQTIQGGDPPAAANGDVTIAINVQPIAFGVYTVRVRAVAGSLKSVDSDPATFARVPGKPTDVRLGGGL